MTQKKVKEEQICQFISAVRSQPFLYDKAHAFYKHHNKKLDAWADLAKEFSFPGLFSFQGFH
jgi:hypothetical protein